MSTSALKLTVLAGLLLAVTPRSIAQTAASGYVEPSSAGDGCNQDLTHSLTDPCTNIPIYLRSWTVDLSAYYCRHVTVSGWDMGVECVILDVNSIQETPPSCPIGVGFLQVIEKSSTWLDWERLPCVETYDVMRGTFPGPAERGGVVDLGPVSCLANDQPNTTTFSNRDTEFPLEGTGFLYLVRGFGPVIGRTSYGSSSAGLERTPTSGDCPSPP